MTTIQIIIGSVRKKRIGDQVAAWMSAQVLDAIDVAPEIVDLAEWPLPMDDEPDVPKDGSYVMEHTKAWSRKIAAANAFVFVFPQYNWGYPAVLKNAVDHLFWEWTGKPAVIVTYAHRGGGKAANQFREVLMGLRMKPVETMPAFKIGDEMFGQSGRIVDPAHAFDPFRAEARKALVELSLSLNEGVG